MRTTSRYADASLPRVALPQDGIHIDGLCSDITISDCAFATGDDAIALNAPEGYGGDITRVTVTNCRFNNALTVMRIYTSLDPAAMPSNNVHRVRNVVVSNCTGTVSSVCFNLGITNGGLSSTGDVDQLQDLTVSNCSFDFAAGTWLCCLTPAGRAFVFPAASRYTPTGRPRSRGDQAATSAGSANCCWTMCGCSAMPTGNAAPSTASSHLYDRPHDGIDRVTLLNCRVVDEEGNELRGAAQPGRLRRARSPSAAAGGRPT